MPCTALLQGRVSLVGQYYVVTTVTRGRRTLFDSLVHGRLVIHAIRARDLAGYTQTLACVVMPDHIHWLLRLMKSSLSEVVGRFKGCVALDLNRLRHTRGSVWQSGFHDHAVRTDESLERIARYVIENPMRAGLVTDIGAYALWHSAWDV